MPTINTNPEDGLPFLKYVARDLSATATEFYDRLEHGQLATTQCANSDCIRSGKPAFPPIPVCPACSRLHEWVELPLVGTLHAFTTQERALRYMAPTVFAVVDVVPGVAVPGIVNAKYESLAVGQPVTIKPFADAQSGLTLLEFAPI